MPILGEAKSHISHFDFILTRLKFASQLFIGSSSKLGPQKRCGANLGESYIRRLREEDHTTTSTISIATLGLGSIPPRVESYDLVMAHAYGDLMLKEKEQTLSAYSLLFFRFHNLLRAALVNDVDAYTKRHKVLHPALCQHSGRMLCWGNTILCWRSVYEPVHVSLAKAATTSLKPDDVSHPRRLYRCQRLAVYLHSTSVFHQLSFSRAVIEDFDPFSCSGVLEGGQFVYTHQVTRWTVSPRLAG
ncbi:uncharacterized protein ARMOST_02187 [Armillaria ostoyae]|uniref:Uncharacterized protein n=1 Tax=Armillaria ostoyae TaxID=47428 RepID=A0A284QR79_ARMOS|nr:uncharacterized protein ARMOST_02187 [Armillaria ostoyae]